MFITKYRHNKIAEDYERHINDLKEALYRKEKFEEIVEKLTDKTVENNDFVTGFGSATICSNMPDNVATYVPDVFGGEVIKQEATPVTTLDKEGKATYGYTRKKAPKGDKYILVK